MPIRVRYKNDSAQECSLRPTPFISINTNILKSGGGEAFGVTYEITLNGTLLDDEGTPYAINHIGDNTALFPFEATLNNNPNDDFVFLRTGPYGAFDSYFSADRNSIFKGKPPKQRVPIRNKMTALMNKQRALRALFAVDGQRVELTDIDGHAPVLICYPRVNNISFSEGNYVNKCEYSITLEADTLLYGDVPLPRVDDEGKLSQPPIRREGNGSFVYNSLIGASGQEISSAPRTGGIYNESQLIDQLKAAFISDFSEDWSIEVDESQGETVVRDPVDSSNDIFLPRSYRITHSLSATGKRHYRQDVADGLAPASSEISAWMEAKKFVLNRMSENCASDYPNNYPNVFGQIGDGTINLVSLYNGFNHVRTESINEAQGSYSINETWILASGSALEQFNISINTSNSDPFVGVSIDGNIKGLSTIPPSGYGGNLTLSPDIEEIDGNAEQSWRTLGKKSAYQNALEKYQDLTNHGKFGVISDVFKRANNSVSVDLNAQPISASFTTNEYTGEITYNLQFNNRPVNIISGVLAEQISVNDTYPGDIFATIPVIGRANGPILQYIGGRTEYRRDLSLNLTMDYTKIPYGNTRNPLLLKKPSIVEPTASQIADLIKEVSPKGEPGIRKYFIAPPSESWNPKEGTYSISISWTYELDNVGVGAPQGGYYDS